MHSLKTRTEAARALGISVATLNRKLKNGAPQARQGQRGRGHKALFDVEALRRYIDDLQPPPKTLSTDVVACIAWQQFVNSSGPHKTQLAGELAAFAYRILWELGDTEKVATLEKLRAIFRTANPCVRG